MKGCECQGEVKIVNYLKSSNGCEFEDVTCPVDHGTTIQRQYLSNHLEDAYMRHMVDCQYCNITGEHQFIKDGHKEYSKFPIGCPNKCKADNMPRDNIDEHIKICPLEEVTCPNDCGITLQ